MLQGMRLKRFDSLDRCIKYLSRCKEGVRFVLFSTRLASLDMLQSYECEVRHVFARLVSEVYECFKCYDRVVSSGVCPD